MRVLVTGGTGFIGRHLVRVLAAQGHEVVCLVREGSQRGRIAADVAAFVTGDMTDEAALAQAVQGCDVVYHLACVLKVPWRAAFRDTNLRGAACVAGACGAAPQRPPLLLLSSLAAGGPSPDSAPRVEADPDGPISLYGQVKRASEEAAREAAGGATVVVVRPPMVFGEEDPWTAKLFRSAARGVHLVPGGEECSLSLIHVLDLVEALAALGARAGTAPEGLPPLLYAAHPEVVSYRALGSRLGAAVGRSVVRTLTIPLPVFLVVAWLGELWARLRDRPSLLTLDKYREATAGSWTCSPAVLQHTLALPAPPPLQQRLEQTASWYRSEGWI